MSTQHTMKQSLLLLLLAVVIPALVVSAAQADGGWIIQPKEIEFKPVQHPSYPGPVDLLFRFVPPESYKGDGQFRVMARPLYAGSYSGPEEWTITAFPDKPHEEILHMTIAPDTVSGLTLLIYGDMFHLFPSVYFIHRNDSVEFWKGYPLGPQPPADRTQQPDDTLEIRFSLRDTTQLRQVLEIVGQLPDSSLGKMIATTTTWRQFLQISNLGIDAKNWDVPRGGGTTNPKSDPRVNEHDTARSKVRIPPKPDLDTLRDTSRQGSLNPADKDRSTLIWIDTVLPMLNDSTVQATSDVEFRVHLYNGLSYDIYGSTNGFEVYSPDGATWDTIWGEWESVGTEWFEHTFVNYFNIDQPGDDTVGFGAFRIYYSGLPTDSVAWAWTIILDLSDEYNIGRTICIDSAYYPPGGEWLWSLAPNSLPYEPPWDGPHCFAIARVPHSCCG